MEEQAKYQVQTIPKAEIINIEDYAMSIEGLVRQVQLIQQVMEKTMKKDEHYGVIPGTQKPTLLKPGAEKLCLTFRLDPHYDIIREIREKDFIAYTVKCDLVHIPSSNHIASGIGSCNSRETKYRYRSQSTGKPVPKDYWDDRDPNKLGGPQYTPRKKDKQWVIFEQIENDNPWDLDNTLIKMACKRALVASTLNATAASDIFTQDIEDMPPSIINGSGPIIEEKQEEKEPETKKASAEKHLTDAQFTKIRKLISEVEGFSADDKKEFYDWIKANKAQTMEVNGKQVITQDSAKAIINDMVHYVSEYIELKMGEQVEEDPFK